MAGWNPSSMNRVAVIEADERPARDWMRQSLEQGNALAAAVLARQRFDQGRFRTLVDERLAVRPPTAFATGGVRTARGFDEAFTSVLNEYAERRAACVVVEDDLVRAGDPALNRSNLQSAFLGDRVVNWTDLGPGYCEDAIYTIQAGSSGYPLNAFLTFFSCEKLGLKKGHQLDSGVPNRVAESLVAVIVAAYDAESYLMWDAL